MTCLLTSLLNNMQNVLPPSMDRIVFINYPAGCFGSFLTQCLHHSESSHHRLPNSDVFMNDGTAHRYIIEYLDSFHTPQQLNEWTTKSKEEKYALLNQRWTPPVDFLNSTLYYIHRLTLPKYNFMFKMHLPASKFVKITIDDSEMDFLADILCRKIPYGPNNQPNTPDIIKTYFKRSRSNYTEDGVYNFNVRNFIDGTFLDEFDKLCEWLNFEKVSDIGEFYDKFKKVNKLA